MTILPPPLRIPATLPPRRALRLRRPSIDDLLQPPVRTSSHWGPIALFVYLVAAFAVICLMMEGM
ncbi:MAG TPA: hypothetical protein VJU61_09975 [Polyangiaceae bacterium]|nr:hypothetical protein [Polyangiaceae bacterium]